MAEQAEDTGASGVAALPRGPGADPMAMALAIEGASVGKADRYLDEHTALAGDQRTLIANQNRVLHLQAEEMRAEEPYKLSHFRLRRFSDWAKAAFEFSLGILALALVAGVSALAWNAAHSDGVVIESFAVPPDMAAKGLSGQVIASQTLDKLAAIIISTNGSVRAAKTYSNGASDDIKVEIPETGVSVGEAYRFLKTWLGHETRISGEVWRTASGIAVTARISGQEGATFTGAEADLPALVGKVAEHIARQTQPYRFGVYLLCSQNRSADTLAVFQELATSGPAQERPWGYVGWANSVRASGGSTVYGVSLLRQALVLQPDNVLVLNNLSGALHGIGHFEESLHLREKELPILSGGASQSVDANVVPSYRQSTQAYIHGDKGALREAVQEMRGALSLRGGGNTAEQYYFLVNSMAALHEVESARFAQVDGLSQSGTAANASQAISARLAVDHEAQDWTALLTHAKALDPLLVSSAAARELFLARDAPRIALAQAKLGNLTAAETSLKPMSAGCYPCLIARAQVAELQGQHARAHFWFTRATEAGPSLPFAFEAEGRSLLARGKPDDAIAQFILSNKKGPHFADALEGWGEALMAKNQSHLAVAKFAEAEKYAPNWGRLHLKWGEALVYAGKADEAKAQFARAATLDLTPAEKSELARFPDTTRHKGE